MDGIISFLIKCIEVIVSIIPEAVGAGVGAYLGYVFATKSQKKDREREHLIDFMNTSVSSYENTMKVIDEYTEARDKVIELFGEYTFWESSSREVQDRYLSHYRTLGRTDSRLASEVEFMRDELDLINNKSIAEALKRHIAIMENLKTQIETDFQTIRDIVYYKHEVLSTEISKNFFNSFMIYKLIILEYQKDRKILIKTIKIKVSH